MTFVHRFSILLFLVVLALPSVCAANQATIFIYHRFDENRYPSTNISSDNFTAHLQYLKDSGRPVTTLSQIINRLTSGQKIVERPVVLSVDDAFDSFLEVAMPLLRRYGYPVTLFVNTDGVGGPGYLDWNQLRRLVREGVTIGNHTATHDYLLERKEGEDAAGWAKRVKNDILRAQDAFEQELGLRPDLFAYPYGEFSPELAAIVRELGFRAAVAQQSGVVHAGSDLYALPRFPMGGPYASLESFQSKAAMHPFVVKVLEPETPVLTGATPPRLKFEVDPQVYELDRLQGFVQGQNSLVFDNSGLAQGVISVVAEKTLSGRRNKYTLTVPLRDGAGWAWFSQPWFRPSGSSD